MSKRRPSKPGPRRRNAPPPPPAGPAPADPVPAWAEGVADQFPPGTELFSFDVTYEPVEDPSMPPEVGERYTDLYELAMDRPAEAVGPLEDLARRYPDVPKVSNLLLVAYTRAGRREDADALTERSFRQFPDYLFARVAYAQLLLDRDDDPAAVLAAMGGHFNLRRMYPDRTEFHVSEVRAVFGVMGQYAVATGDLDAAERCLALLEEIDPDADVIRVIDHQLMAASMEVVMARMLAQSARPRKPRKKPAAAGKPRRPKGDPPRNAT